LPVTKTLEHFTTIVLAYKKNIIKLYYYEENNWYHVAPEEIFSSGG